MNDKQAILQMRLPERMKNKAAKVAKRGDMTLSQWVRKQIAAGLLREIKP